MPAVKVTLDRKLLQETDRAAREESMTRSAFIRAALQAHIRARLVLAMEEAERRGYEKHPDSEDVDLAGLEEMAVWPDD